MTTFICLEGVHGIGKSTLCRFAEQKGINVLKEDFIPEHSEDGSRTAEIDRTGCLLQILWMANWFKSALKTNLPNKVVFCDRSPISCLIYKEKDVMNKEFILAAINELEKLGHKFIFFRLTPADLNFVWQRVQARISLEPYRLEYKEDNKEWLQMIETRYSQRMNQLVKEIKIVVSEDDRVEDVYQKIANYCKILP